VTSSQRRHGRAPGGRPFLASLAAAVMLSGCMNGGILRAPAPTPLPTMAPTAFPPAPSDPQPLAFPRDEGPHHRLTEWWYYTGHLETEQGRRFGFEFVIFRAERGDFPVAWASHFAITDGGAGMFRYEERFAFGPQVDRSPLGGSFDLAIAAVATPNVGTPDPAPGASLPWTMAGALGRDRLVASGSPGAIDLTLTTDRPPVLHDRDGYIDLGPAGGTYYYSRTRMAARGTLTLPGQAPFAADGQAWFDHQWGDFIAVGAGGWDWFSVQLEDGRDLTISVVRGPNDAVALIYGTLVAADRSARHLAADEIEITISPHTYWRSPRSGALYPARWRIELPGEDLDLDLLPTMQDQELDTTASTGVVYWEGQVTVTGSDGDTPVAGVGYVELTGYVE